MYLFSARKNIEHASRTSTFFLVLVQRQKEHRTRKQNMTFLCSLWYLFSARKNIKKASKTENTLSAALNRSLSSSKPCQGNENVRNHTLDEV